LRRPSRRCGGSASGRSSSSGSGSEKEVDCGLRRRLAACEPFGHAAFGPGAACRSFARLAWPRQTLLSRLWAGEVLTLPLLSPCRPCASSARRPMCATTAAWRWPLCRLPSTTSTPKR
jgi:hypothetical protein